MEVLFIVFNRPDTTAQVWEAIAEQKPHKLYVAADGPRIDVPADKERCDRVREIVSAVNWDCSVRRLYHPQNLGCNIAVRSAIDWYFRNEAKGIILEDDCLPDPSFFRYCSELLDKYRLNEEVLMISGTNLIPSYRFSESYAFSRITNIWGWASWRRAWQLYDAEMRHWPEYSKSDDLAYFGDYADDVFDSLNSAYSSEPIYNWAIPWRFACMFRQMVSIVPRSNLVRNIGFGHPDATRHRRSLALGDIPVQPMKFPLVHPKIFVPNREYDLQFRRYVSKKEISQGYSPK